MFVLARFKNNCTVLTATWLKEAHTGGIYPALINYRGLLYSAEIGNEENTMLIDEPLFQSPTDYIMKIEAKVASIDTFAPVYILKHLSNEDVVAFYNGSVCKAVFNPSTVMYYVDDVNGIIRVLD